MKDYVGRKFGRLEVLELTESVMENNGRRRTTYVCRCDCGTVLNRQRHYLQNKRTANKSCGCVNSENRSKLGLAKRKYHPRTATADQLYRRTYSDGDITLEQFMSLSQNNCFYCNAKPGSRYNKYIHRFKAKNSDYAKQEGEFIYNGLDRIDSNLPHNINNVVPCCIQCNWSKSNKSVDEFRSWIIRVYEYWAKEKGR